MSVNCYPENLLLCLLGSSELEDRKFGVRIIMKIRRKEREQKEGDKRREAREEKPKVVEDSQEDKGI